MINRELIEVFSEIAREKNVERSELASILEELFLYVIEKEYGDSSNCSCIVNLDKGEIEIYAEKTIVKEIDDYKVEITLDEAIKKEPEAEDLELGDVFVEVIDPRVFGRRLITTAKQFLMILFQSNSCRYFKYHLRQFYYSNKCQTKKLVFHCEKNSFNHRN